MKENPKWPSDLGKIIEYGKPVTVYNLSPDQLLDSEGVAGLLHDLYWFSDDKFFMYEKVESNLSKDLLSCFESMGVETAPIHRCCYQHPRAVHQNDYVHLPPEKLIRAWQKDAAGGQEYSRFTLTLSAWKRKEMDMLHIAEAGARAMDKPAPLVSAKPGMFGFSFDLIAAFQRLRSRAEK